MTAIGPAPDGIRLDPETEKKWARQRTEKWLEGVYKNELGRDLGDEGRAYWTDDIHDRGQTKDEVLANIRRSNEYKGYQRGIEDATPVPLPSPPIHGDPGPKSKPEKPIRWTPKDTDRKYGIYDAISAASSAGNRMTDDYYGRFLPEMRKNVMLGINEIGAADRYHGNRYEGKPPEYTDPDELFEKYKRDDDNDESSDLEKRIKALEDKYKIA